MKIILTENVDNLGKMGEIKEVKSGYARNYLIPKKLAVQLSDKKSKGIIRQLSEIRGKEIQEEKRLRDEAKSLDGKEIEIMVATGPLRHRFGDLARPGSASAKRAKTDQRNKLFGAVTSSDVAKKLRIDKKKIKMEPVKQIGESEAKIDFGKGITSKVKVIVKPKKR
jgi:large subunit ribosomal protein L9